MAYTLPVFNVPVNVWSDGRTPDDGAADFENVTTQFYIYSRVSFDVQPCELELYQPPIQVRMPIAAVVAWTDGQVFEVPALSARFYRARFKERVHMNFVNEYLVVYVVQCGSDGIPILRDIEGAEPCGGPSGVHVASGGPDGIEAGMSSEGHAHNSSFSGVHNVDGTALVQGIIQGDGEAGNIIRDHIFEGTGEVATGIDGQGSAEANP